MTLAAVEAYGVDRMLCELSRDLREGRYRPARVRRVEIRKPDGRWRALGVMSGRMWEQQRMVRYYLHRWPSARALTHARARVRALTSRSRVGVDLRETIGALYQFLRGWGGCFRTGNAPTKFRQLDRQVVWRLEGLLIKRTGRNLRAGQVDRWTPAWSHDQGLHQQSGTIRYPKAA